jgi:hypothetical protein
MAPWYESLWNGVMHCCGVADCREESRVLGPRNSSDGHWWVFLSKHNFGDGAPDKMVRVPDGAEVEGNTAALRPDNAVVCAHRPDYASAFGLVILCFIPPRIAG